MTSITLHRSAAVLALSITLSLGNAITAQDKSTKWLDPQINYFTLDADAPVEIGYRRGASEGSFMGVGWVIKNKTDQKAEFFMDQYYYCNGRLVQERKNSFMCVGPGATLRGGRFMGDDPILWDDFFFGTGPGDQLRKGEVIDRVGLTVRWKEARGAVSQAQRDAGLEQARRDAAAARELERQAAARREQEQRDEQERRALQRQQQEQRDALRRQQDAERVAQREAERQSQRDAQQRDREQRILDNARSRIRQVNDTTDAINRGIGEIGRKLQERMERERQEQERADEEEREERRQERRRRDRD